MLSGKNYFSAAEYEKAKSNYLSILDRYAGSNVYFSAMLELSLVYIEQKNPVLAKKYLGKVMESSANKNQVARAIYTDGLINLKQGYSTNAEKSFNTLSVYFHNDGL